MEQIKKKIKELVEAINLVYVERDWKVERFMEVDFWGYCNLYLWKKENNYKSTLYKSMNYKEVMIFLKGYLEAL